MGNNFYCRTCLSENIKLNHSLFENNILNILIECTSVKINISNNNLSTKICDVCFKTIKLIKKFIEKCTECENILENRHKTDKFIKSEPLEISSNDLNNINQIHLNNYDDNEKFLKDDEIEYLKKTRKRKISNKLENFKIENTSENNSETSNLKIDFETLSRSPNLELNDSAILDSIDKKEICNDIIKQENLKNKKELEFKLELEEKIKQDTKTNLDDENQPPKYFLKEFTCSYCNKTLRDLHTFRRHKISQKHKRAVLKTKKINSRNHNETELESDKNLYFKKNKNGLYFCEFCNLKNKRLKNIHNHYFEKHNDALTIKYLSESKNTELNQDKLKYCFVCKETFERSLLNSHCLTRQHKLNAGLLKKKDTKKIKPKVETLFEEELKKDDLGQYFCTICNFIFMELPKYELHIDSPLHKEFQAKVSELNLNIQSIDLDKLIELVKSEGKNKKIQTYELYCEPCSELFRRGYDLERHNNSMRHKKNLENFNPEQSAKQLKNIENSNDKKSKFTCIYCDEEYLSSEKHLKSLKHKDTIRKLNILVKKANIELISNAPHTCKLCNITFSTRQKFNNHTGSRLHERMAKKSFPFKEEEEDEGQKNILTNTKLQEYHCVDCNYTYFSLKQYNTHIQTHSDELQKTSNEKELVGAVWFKCKYCSRKFRKRRSLYKHINYHKGIYTVSTDETICYICGLKVKIIDSHLSNKHNIHNKPIKHICRICKDRPEFSSAESLLDHLKIVHRTKSNKERVTCLTCGANIDKHKLKRHMDQVHLDIRPFECEVCHKRFKCKWDLKGHFMIHTDERPFACDICFQAFRDKKTMKNHRNIHTGERFACDACGKTFSQKSCVRQHKKKDHPQIYANETKKIFINTWFPFS